MNNDSDRKISDLEHQIDQLSDRVDELERKLLEYKRDGYLYKEQPLSDRIHREIEIYHEESNNDNKS